MTPLDALARAAEQAATDAAEEQALLVAMEAKIRAGDATITADQFAEQQRLARFAELRAAGARSTLDQAKSPTSMRAVKAAKTALSKIAQSQSTDPAPVLTAWKDTVMSVRRLLEAAQSRDRHIQETADLVRALDDSLAGSGMSMADLGFAHGGRFMEPGFRIPAAGVEVTAVRPGPLVALAIESAVSKNDIAEISGAITVAAPSDQVLLRSLSERLPGLMAVADEVQHPDVALAQWRSERATA